MTDTVYDLETFPLTTHGLYDQHTLWDENPVTRSQKITYIALDLLIHTTREYTPGGT